MKIKTFKRTLVNILKKAKSNSISDIYSDGYDYINILCNDNSVFSIQIQEAIFSKYMLNNTLQDVATDVATRQYLENHTREDFLEELDHLHIENPDIFEKLIILMKIKEMGIISHSSMLEIVEKLEHKLSDK